MYDFFASIDCQAFQIYKHMFTYIIFKYFVRHATPISRIFAFISMYFLKFKF